MKQLLIVLSWFVLLPIAAQKQKDIEYIARKKATIAAMDSLLKNAQVQLDVLIKFADQKCKEFHNDPELVSAIAMSFAIYAGDENVAMSRFQDLIKSNPKNVQCYIDYANMLHSKAEEQGYVGPNIDYVKRAKHQIDSAKIVAPNSPLPYRSWVNWRTPYVHIAGVQEDVTQEIEAWNKHIPDSKAYLLAARILMGTDIKKIKNETLRQGFGQRRITDMAIGYFEKAGVENMEPIDFWDLARQYYQSSVYLGKNERVTVFEKSAEMACKGYAKSGHLSERDRFTYFGRYILWSGAEIANRDTTALGRAWADSAAVMADAYSRSSDMGWQDLYYSGLAYQNKGRYEESIEMFRKALASTDIADNNPYFSIGAFPAMENIISCYQSLHDYASAISERKNLISLKQEKSKHTILDLRTLIWDYIRIYRDRNSNTQDSIMAYQGIDASCQIFFDSIDSGHYTDYTTPQGLNLQRDLQGFYSEQLTAHQQLDRLMAGQHDSQLTRNCADRVIRKYEKVSGRSKEENILLARAYYIWVVYYLEHKDMRKWAFYAQSILDVHPNLVTEATRERWRNLIKHYGGGRR